MLREALGSKSYIMMLEEMPESVFVDMGTGDVDVCEEKSHKNSLLSGSYDGYRGQEGNRKGESFLSGLVILWVNELNFCLLWKLEKEKNCGSEVRTAVQWFSRK